MKNGFADVAAGQYYTDAVTWAANCGIVKGVSETSFAPNAAVTREQMVTFLYRYTQWCKKDTASSGNLEGFRDGSAVSGFAKDSMTWAVSNKIIQGDDGRILPKGTATRAQVAAILARFLEQ